MLFLNFVKSAFEELWYTWNIDKKYYKNNLSAFRLFYLILFSFFIIISSLFIIPIDILFLPIEIIVTIIYYFKEN